MCQFIVMKNIVNRIVPEKTIIEVKRNDLLEVMEATATYWQEDCGQSQWAATIEAARGYLVDDNIILTENEEEELEKLHHDWWYGLIAIPKSAYIPL